MANKHPNTSGFIPAKKGEVRNPKGINGFSEQRKFLSRATTEEDMLTIFKKAIELAQDGDRDLIKWTTEYLYGKTADNLNIKQDITIDDVTDSLVKRIKGK